MIRNKSKTKRTPKSRRKAKTPIRKRGLSELLEQRQMLAGDFVHTNNGVGFELRLTADGPNLSLVSIFDPSKDPIRIDLSQIDADGTIEITGSPVGEDLLLIDSNINLDGRNLVVDADTIRVGSSASRVRGGDGWTTDELIEDGETKPVARVHSGLSVEGGRITADVFVDEEGEATASLTTIQPGFNVGEEVVIAPPDGVGEPLVLRFESIGSPTITTSTRSNTRDAGSITLTGETIALGPGSVLDTNVVTGSSFEPGDITVVAVNAPPAASTAIVDGISPLIVRNQDAEVVAAGAVIRGGDISITASGASTASWRDVGLYGDQIGDRLLGALSELPDLAFSSLSPLSGQVKVHQASAEIDATGIQITSSGDVELAAEAEATSSFTTVGINSTTTSGAAEKVIISLGVGTAITDATILLAGDAQITAAREITIDTTAESEGEISGRAAGNTRASAGAEVDFAISGAVSYTEENSTIFVGRDATVESSNGNINIHATGAVSNSAESEAAIFRDGDVGISVALGVDIANVSTTVNGTVTALNPPEVFFDFDSGNVESVDLDDNTISLTDVPDNNALELGQRVTYQFGSDTGATAIGGLADGETYHVISLDEAQPPGEGLIQTVGLARSTGIQIDSLDAANDSTHSLARLVSNSFQTSSVRSQSDGDPDTGILVIDNLGIPAGTLVTYVGPTGELDAEVDEAVFGEVTGNRLQLTRTGSGSWKQFGLAPGQTFQLPDFHDDGTTLLVVDVSADGRVLTVDTGGTLLEIPDERTQTNFALKSSKVPFVNGLAFSEKYTVEVAGSETRLRDDEGQLVRTALPSANADRTGVHGFYFFETPLTFSPGGEDADVNSDTNTIRIPGHDLQNGTLVRYKTDPNQSTSEILDGTNGTTFTRAAYELPDEPVTGLDGGSSYFVTVVDNDHIRLAPTRAAVTSSLPIELTSLGSGQHSLLPFGSGNGIGITASLEAENGASASVAISDEEQTWPDVGTNILSGDNLVAAGRGLVGTVKEAFNAFSANTQNTPAAATTSEGGTEVAGTVAVSIPIHSVSTSVGSSANLTTRGDLVVSTDIEQQSFVGSDAEATRNARGADDQGGQPGQTPDPDDEGDNEIAVAIGVGFHSNNANTSIANDATLDASETITVDASVTYPSMFEGIEAFRDPLSALGESGFEAVANFADPGGLLSDGFNVTGIAHAGDPDRAGGDKLAIGLVAMISVFDNEAVATVGSDAQLNQNEALQSDEQQVEVLANTDINFVEVGHQAALNLDVTSFLEGGLDGVDSAEDGEKLKGAVTGPFEGLFTPIGISGKKSIGPVALVNVMNNDTVARILDGADIHVGSAEDGLKVEANQEVDSVAVAHAGGQSSELGVSITATVGIVNSLTQASIGQSVTITGGGVAVDATDDVNRTNVNGGLLRGEQTGLGTSIGVNVHNNELKAFIGRKTSSEPTTVNASPNIDVDGPVTVTAVSTGDLVSVSLAGVLQQTKEEDPNDSFTSIVNSLKASAKSQTGDSDSGGPAIALAIPAGINLVNGKIEARIDDQNVDAGSVNVEAKADQNVRAIAVGGAAAIDDSDEANKDALSIAGAGALAINFSDQEITATISDSIVETQAADGIAVRADDKSRIRTDGGGFGIALSKGRKSARNVAVGATFGMNDLENTTIASITNSDATARVGDIIVEASGSPEVEALAIGGGVSAGVGQKDTLSAAFAGAFTFNELENTTEAFISNASDVDALAGDVVVVAIDESEIDSDAGGVAISFALGGSGKTGTGSIGLGIGLNEIENNTKAYIDDASVEARDDIRVESRSTAEISNLAIAGSAAVSKGGGQTGAFGGAGVGARSNITNTTEAFIKDASEDRLIASELGNVSVVAEDLSEVTNTAFGASIAVSASGDDSASIAVGVSIARAQIENTNHAYIENSKVTTPSGNVNVTVNEDATIDTVSVAASIAFASGENAVSVSGGGASAANVVLNRSSANISDSELTDNRDVVVSASGRSFIDANVDAIAGALSLSGNTATAASVGASRARNFIGFGLREDADDVAEFSEGIETNPDGTPLLPSRLRAFIENSTIDVSGSLTVTALNDLKIDTDVVAASAVASLGNGSAGGLSGAGVGVNNKIRVQTDAFIDGDDPLSDVDRTVEANRITVKADNTSNISAVGVGAALALGVGQNAGALTVGVSLASNEVENTTAAFIDNANVASSGPVIVQADAQDLGIFDIGDRTIAADLSDASLFGDVQPNPGEDEDDFEERTRRDLHNDIRILSRIRDLFEGVSEDLPESSFDFESDETATELLKGNRVKLQTARSDGLGSTFASGTVLEFQEDDDDDVELSTEDFGDPERWKPVEDISISTTVEPTSERNGEWSLVTKSGSYVIKQNDTGGVTVLRSSIESISVAASVGIAVGTGGIGIALSGAGATSRNTIDNTVDAYISNSSLRTVDESGNPSSEGRTSITARDSSGITATVVSAAVAGGGGPAGGGAASLGVSVTENIIGSKTEDAAGESEEKARVHAYAENSSINVHSLDISATSSPSIVSRTGAVSLAIAVGKIAGSLAGAGVKATNDIGMDVQAWLDDENGDADRIADALNIHALDNSRINASAGAVSVSIVGALFGGTGAVGVTVAENKISNSVEAYIANAPDIAARKISVKATESAEIDADLVAVAVAAGFSIGAAAAVSAPVSENTITNSLDAFVENSSITSTSVADQTGVEIVAIDEPTISAELRSIATSGSVFAGSGAIGIVRNSIGIDPATDRKGGVAARSVRSTIDGGLSDVQLRATANPVESSSQRLVSVAAGFGVGLVGTKVESRVSPSANVDIGGRISTEGNVDIDADTISVSDAAIDGVGVGFLEFGGTNSEVAVSSIADVNVLPDTTIEANDISIVSKTSDSPTAITELAGASGVAANKVRVSGNLAFDSTIDVADGTRLTAETISINADSALNVDFTAEADARGGGANADAHTCVTVATTTPLDSGIFDHCAPTDATEDDRPAVVDSTQDGAEIEPSRTQVQIGAARLEARIVDLDATLSRLKINSQAESDAVAIGVDTDSNARIAIFNSTNVHILDGANIVGDVVNVSAVVSPDAVNLSLTSNSDSDAVGIGNENAFVSVDNISEAKVTADTGARVSAAELNVSAEQNFRPENDTTADAGSISRTSTEASEAPDQVTGSNDATRTIDWNADTVHLSGPSPSLTIAGGLVEATNLTIEGHVPDSPLADPINIGPIISDSTGSASFTTNEVPDVDGLTAPAGSITGSANSILSSSFRSVDINSDSSFTMNLRRDPRGNAIHVANADPNARPDITIDSEEPGLTFTESRETLPTTVEIKHGGQINLTGSIENPLGPTTIESTGASVFAANDAVIRTSSPSLNAAGQLGLASNRINVHWVDLPESDRNDVAEPGNFVAGGNVFLDITGRLRDQTRDTATFVVERLAAGANVDVILQPTAKDSTQPSNASLDPLFFPELADTRNVESDFELLDVDGSSISVVNPVATSSRINISAETEMSDSGRLVFVTTGDIGVTEETGDLRIGNVNTTRGNVSLKSSSGSILATDGNNLSVVPAVSGNEITLDSAGEIGSSSNSLRINSQLQDRGTVSATAPGNIFLNEVTGNLVVRELRSTAGNVNLRAERGSITDTSDVSPTIAGNDLFLVSIRESVGTLGNTLEIDTGEQGRLFVSAGADANLLETTGELNIEGASASNILRLTVNDSGLAGEDLILLDNAGVTAGESLFLIAGDDLLVPAGARVEAARVTLGGDVSRGFDDFGGLIPSPDDFGTHISVAGEVLTRNLRLEGGNEADTIEIVDERFNSALLARTTTFVGGAADDQFFLQQSLGPTILDGGDGADQFFISRSTSSERLPDGTLTDEQVLNSLGTEGSLDLNIGGITINTGNGGSQGSVDEIFIHAGTGAAPNGTLDGTAITGLGMLGGITVNVPESTSAEVKLGLPNADDTFNVKGLAANLEAHVYGFDGSDTLNVANDSQQLDDVDGVLAFFGGEGFDQLEATGSGLAAPVGDGFDPDQITAIGLTGFGMGENRLQAAHNRFGAGFDPTQTTLPGAIYFATRTSGGGIGDSPTSGVGQSEPVDTFETSVEQLFLRLSAGDDSLRIDSSSPETNVVIFGGDGNDTFEFGSTTTGLQPAFIERLDFLQGNVFPLGEAGSDVFVFDDSGDLDAEANVGTLNGFSLTGLGIGGSVGLGDIGENDQIDVRLGDGPDKFFVASTASQTSTTVHAGHGFDEVFIGTTEGSESTGTLDRIQGDLKVVGGEPDAGNVLHINAKTTRSFRSYTVDNDPQTAVRPVLLEGQEAFWPIDTTTITQGDEIGTISYERFETVVLNSGASVNLHATHREQDPTGGKNSTFVINEFGGNVVTIGKSLQVGSKGTLEDFRIDISDPTPDSPKGIPVFVNGQGNTFVTVVDDTTDASTNVGLTRQTFNELFPPQSPSDNATDVTGQQPESFEELYQRLLGPTATTDTYGKLVVSHGDDLSPVNINFAQAISGVAMDMGAGGNVVQLDQSHPYDLFLTSGNAENNYNIRNSFQTTTNGLNIFGGTGDDTLFVDYANASIVDSDGIAQTIESVSTFVDELFPERRFRLGRYFVETRQNSDGDWEFQLLDDDDTPMPIAEASNPNGADVTGFQLIPFDTDVLFDTRRGLLIKFGSNVEQYRAGKAELLWGAPRNAQNISFFAGRASSRDLFQVAGDGFAAGGSYTSIPSVARSGTFELLGNTITANDADEVVVHGLPDFLFDTPDAEAADLAIRPADPNDLELSDLSLQIITNRGVVSWVPEASLTIPDAVEPKQLGHVMAASGDTLVVGAELEGQDHGTVFVYVLEDTGWKEKDRLLPNDLALGHGHGFGQSVAISGDQLIVGAPDDDGRATDAGAAYLFERNADGVWVQQQRIEAPDARQSIAFGTSVAVDNSFAVVGAPGRSKNTAYFFGRTGETWNLTDQESGQDGFGHAVAIRGDVAAVGVPEAIYVDRPFVDPSGDGVLIEAFGGTVEVYERQPDNSFDAVSTIVAPENADSGRLGSSLAMPTPTRIVAGAPGCVTCDVDIEGQAFVFDSGSSPSTWQVSARLTADGGLSAEDAANERQPGNQFGISVAADGNHVVVGAPAFDGATQDQGAAYAFFEMEDQGSSSTWMRSVTSNRDMRLGSSAPARGDLFGQGVAIVGSEIVVGIPGRSDVATNRNNVGAIRSFSTDGELTDESLSLLQAEFLASPDTAANDFGQSIAYHEASKTLFVGSSNRKIDVYVNEGIHWRHTQSIVEQGVAGFGQILDVGVEGDLVVGVPGAGDAAGRVFVYQQEDSPSVEESVRADLAWRRVDTITKPGEPTFGSSVAIQNDLLVVGTPGESIEYESVDQFDPRTGAQRPSPLTVTLRNSGAAYVYERSANGFIETRLLMPDAPLSDRLPRQTFEVFAPSNVNRVLLPGQSPRGVGIHKIETETETLQLGPRTVALVFDAGEQSDDAPHFQAFSNDSFDETQRFDIDVEVWNYLFVGTFESGGNANAFLIDDDAACEFATFDAVGGFIGVQPPGSPCEPDSNSDGVGVNANTLFVVFDEDGRDAGQFLAVENRSSDLYEVGFDDVEDERDPDCEEGIICSVGTNVRILWDEANRSTDVGSLGNDVDNVWIAPTSPSETTTLRPITFRGLDNGRWGSAVDIVGDTILVGASGERLAGVYELGSSRVENIRLSDRDLEIVLPTTLTFLNNEFDVALASESTAIAGGGGGAVTLLNTGNQVEQLVTNGDVTDFGQTIAAEEDTLLVGGTGGAAVYSLSGQSANLLRNVGSPQLFGNITTVAPEIISDGFYAFGAPDRDGIHNFRRHGPTWATTDDDLILPQPTPKAEFGQSIAVDRNLAVVGAPEFDGRGAAFVYQFSGGAWIEEEMIQPPGLLLGSEFGSSVSIHSANKNRIVIGKPNSEGDGSAFVYERDDFNGTWELQQVLDGGINATGVDDRFGSTVDLDADTIVVSDEEFQTVQIFNLESDTQWRFSRQIDAATAAVDGDFVVVGDARSSDAPRVFRKSSLGDWTLEQELAVPTGATLVGASVDISGANVVVGAPSISRGEGQVFTYRRNSANNGWDSPQILTVSPPGLTFEFFDRIPDGNTVDNIPDENPDFTGTATNFDVDSLARRLTGSLDTFAVRYTGFVDITEGGTYTFRTRSDDGSKLFIDDIEVVDNDGLHAPRTVTSQGTVLSPGRHKIVVEFFEAFGGESVTAEFNGPDTGNQFVDLSTALASDFFGFDVAVGDTQLIVGAPDFPGGRGMGFAFGLDQSNVWQLETATPLIRSDSTEGDLVGFSTAVSGGRAFLGAPQPEGREGLAIDTNGAAHFFTRSVSGGVNVTIADQEDVRFTGVTSHQVTGTAGTAELARLNYFDITNVVVRTGERDDTITIVDEDSVAHGLEQLSLQTRGGSDTVRVQNASGQTTESFNLATGNSILGRVTVDGGGGNDRVQFEVDTDVQVQQSVVPDFLVGAFSPVAFQIGNDNVFSADIEQLEIVGGPGDNVFEVNDFEGDVRIDGAGGADRVSLNLDSLTPSTPTGIKVTDSGDGVSDQLILLGDEGDDNVILGTNQLGQGVVAFRDARDFITLSELELVTVNGQTGDDNITVVDSSAVTVELDGGLGADELTVDSLGRLRINVTDSGAAEEGADNDIIFTQSLDFITATEGIRFSDDLNYPESIWRMNERAGDSVFDSGTVAAHGTTHGDPTWVRGQGGTALHFDGEDDFVSFGSNASLAGTIDFTIIAWIRTLEDEGQQVIVQQRGGVEGHDNGHYQFQVVDGRLNFVVFNEREQFNITTSESVADGEWHRVVAQRRGRFGRILIDGSEVAAATGSFVAALDPAFEVSIGYDLTQNDSHFRGTIDDVQIHDFAIPMNRVPEDTAEFVPPTSSPLTDVTSPSDIVTRVDGTNDGDTSTGVPANDSVGNAIDNLTNKYVNLFDEGSGLIIEPAMGRTNITGLRVYTANDSVAADPASYRLEGRRDDGSFTLISEGKLVLPWERNEAGVDVAPAEHAHREVTFENRGGFDAYRLTFPTVRRHSDADALQVAEIELLGRPDRLYGDVNEDGGVDFADFLVLSSNYQAIEAVWADGDFNEDGRVSVDDFLILREKFGFKR